MTARGGGRELKVRVKTGKSRSLSSKLWLERQLNDPYVARAKREGFRSRAAYKLIEIDDKHRLLKPGARVVDLGAAPGGWSQVAAKRTGEGRGRVVAIDLLDMAAVPGVEFLQLDFLDPAAPDKLKALLGGRPTWCSPTWRRTPPATARPITCASWRWPRPPPSSPARCWRRAARSSAKVLQGGTEAALLAELKRDFASVKHVKPAASRADSAELYLLATGFRGPQDR